MANRERTLFLDAEVGGRCFAFENETLTLVGGKEPEVITAYFAEKVITTEEKTHEEPFTFKFKDDDNDLTNKNDDLVNDAKRRKLASFIFGKLTMDSDKKFTTNTNVYEALTETSYKKDDEITISTYKKESKEYYKKLDTAPMGYQVYLVAETKKLDGKTLKIKIQEAKSEDPNKDKVEKEKKSKILKLVKAETDSLPVLVFPKLS